MSKLVLVVEDEPALVSIYQRALEHHGYDVLTAGCAEEALELVQENRGCIDLLLSDIVMPGMSGRELAWRVQEAHPEIKVVLASGYTDADGALQMIEDSGATFVEKPIDLDLLLQTIRESIGAARAG